MQEVQYDVTLVGQSDAALAEEYVRLSRAIRRRREECEYDAPLLTRRDAVEAEVLRRWLVEYGHE